jgi:GNAT superfamily N-acetyltransferase
MVLQSAWTSIVLRMCHPGLVEGRATMLIREAKEGDEQNIARIHVASWNATYRGILPDEVIDARSLDVRLTQWTSSLHQPDRITLVAEDDIGGMLGFISVLLLDRTQHAFDAYLQTLYLDPQAQGHGIGSRLLKAMSARLHATGLRTMFLRVLRRNPATAFYERFGARLIPEGMPVDEGVFKDDLVYAFDDIRTLV